VRLPKDRQLDRQQTLIDEPIPKRLKLDVQKPGTPLDSTFISWKPVATTLQDVQNSYRSLISKGQLNYNRVPQSAPKADGDVKVKPWDPYILPATSLARARLDTKKAKDIKERARSTIRIVPKAVEWIAKTQEHNLTPEDLKTILRIAFDNDGPVSANLPPILGVVAKGLSRADELKGIAIDNDGLVSTVAVYRSRLPPILGVAAKGLTRADELKGISVTIARAESVLRLLAYALMEVSVVAGEATDDQVISINIITYMILNLQGQLADGAIGNWWQRLASAVS